MNIETLYNSYAQHFLVDTDTRKIRKNTIYFALKGANFNGNTFAKEALEKGALLSVVDEARYANQDNIVLVDDVLTTLQELAQYHREKLGIPIIGLTGSNGKTTTKELIHAVLSTQLNVKATFGNLNNHIGVPLTLLSMTPATEIGIVEMGANHHKEIAFLCSIANPDYGYITNFGKAHLEGFGSIEGVIEAKSELYDYLRAHKKSAFINQKNPIQLKKSNGITTLHFDETIQFVEANPLVKILFKGQTIQTNLIGNYNFNNIAVAITIGLHFNISDNNICKAIEGYTPANNRSQIIQTTKNNTVILDAYNANPTSMRAALNSFKELNASNKVVILGDMFELGKDSVKEHQLIVNFCAELDFDNCFFVGQLFSKTNTSYHKLQTFEALKELLLTKNYEQTTFLIKGSRGMALERVLPFID
ncbi:MAG: UDP-N-acetylmuramoyl-tripeptide--D-alanyl-D-alanine ligase [Flavobacteriaceae bacterium]|nr:UDP-N-acetylmuramoyl-tripeptide--D-alanyl-D-alanine ligase [Flavobacteriaceae bacterium]